MNYSDPELGQRLAADYVSGLLRHGARRRFEALMADDPALRSVVLEWENRLLPLALSLEPIAPRARVWRNIHRGITQQSTTRQPMWRSLQVWRSMSAALAAALLAVVLAWQMQPAAPLARVAILQDAQANAAFVVSTSANGIATVRALADLRGRAPGGALELWALPATGKPESLGVLPFSGELRLVAALPSTISELAVSVEPAGGSPTGQPTGAVIFTGGLRHM